MKRIYTSAEQRVIAKFRAQAACICSYCGATLTKKQVRIDHKIPFARGGETVTENLAVACGQCNGEKGTKTPEEFSLYKQFKNDMSRFSKQYLLDSLNYYIEILKERGYTAIDEDGFPVRWKCQAIKKLL